MPSRPVLNTYRLQVHSGFTFDDVAGLVPYLAELGVTHLYLSPITMAAPGSTHGYDVIDPTRLSEDLGGEEGFARLLEAQRAAGLGLVVDVVPNHMGISADAGNEYWADVLCHGPDSPHARIFDVDWQATDDGRPRVILPVLGDAVEEVVARGEIEVDAGSGEIRYFQNRFPLSPESLEWWHAQEDRGAEAVLELLARQHYELAYWRTGKARANYRRFFEIDELIGVRVEDPEVHALMHARVLDLAREGAIDGLRVDHPDGLRDPAEYLRRLQDETPDGTYVVIEKILGEDEALPSEWATDGTSGYEAMNDFLRVLIDPAAEAPLTETYAALTGEHAPFEEIAASCRADVLGGPLVEHFRSLARRLHGGALAAVEEDAFVEAVMALLAHMPVYRTYHTERDLDARAANVIGFARREAERMHGASGALEAAALALVAPPAGEAREAVLRLQQIMPAIQAKALEDRAFYRYRRLLALNEVGGDPDTFGVSVERFHERMAEAQRDWPHRMLASATHDHKRGEDGRARLAALAEFPGEWADVAARALKAFRELEAGDGPRVDASDLYLVLQTALATGALGWTSARPDPDPIGRIGAYLEKALREAGERTHWLDTDEAYERAVIDLATRGLDDGSPVMEIVRPHFEEVARVGAVNALSQLVLKLGAPGVVDTYQGNELWDLSLVDPDNRRQPDYAASQHTLTSMVAALHPDDAGDASRQALIPELLAEWRDGRIKLFVTARALRARRDRPDVFLDGAYRPIEARGAHADHVVAFAREGASATALVVVPRLSRAVNRAGGDALWQPEWGDTHLDLGALLEGAPAGEWRELFTGARVDARAELPLAEVLGAFPVAILLAERA